MNLLDRMGCPKISKGFINLILVLLFFALRSGQTVAEDHGNDHNDQSHGEGDVKGDHGHEIHHYEVFHVEFERVQLPFIIMLWIFVSSLAKIGFHMTPKLHSIFPESCLLIVVGIVIGFLLILTSKEVPTTLTPDTFFLYMLPPIILDAGYFMPNRLFFDHLGTILLMAVMGTVFNMLTIGASLYACGLTGVFGPSPPGILETFLFSSLIVAVDPVAVLAVFEEIHVDEILYIVVFGESLLNDAVTVVLYHMFEAYVEIGEENIVPTDILKGFASFLVVGLGGVIIGIIWGYLTGFVTRFTNHARVLEPLFVFVMAYMSYLNAEIFHLSGILAITFCGITMKNYVERNISSKSQTTLKYAMKMLSGSSETIIFMFLGVATIHDDHEWNWAFVTLTITFCTVFRIIGVILLSSLANKYRLHKLKVVDQFVMMYGGLRGAVAFALVLLIDPKSVPHAPMFVTTTIAVVYWTVFVQGITIKPLVRFLNVKTMSEKEPTMNERIAGRFMDHVVSGMEGILGELGNLRMRDMYKYFDTKYIKPCLLRENQYWDHKIIETFENLTNRDAVEFMKRNPTQFAGLNKSMAELNSTPSFANLQESTSFANMSHANLENLDMKEMVYNPSQKDLTEGKIHHLLSENLFMPRARPRKMSYSRHAMNENDLSMQHDVNYRVHMQVRRMISENRAKRRHRRTVLANSNGGLQTSGGFEKSGVRNSRVTFENEHNDQVSGLRIRGSAKHLRDERVHEVIKEQNSSDSEDDDGGLTFQPHQMDSSEQDLVKITSILPPAYGIGRYLTPPSNSPTVSRRNIKTQQQQAQSSPISTPWLIRGGFSNPAYVKDIYDDDEDFRMDDNPQPTQTEKTLPWKREDNPDRCIAPVRQREFPAWLKNEDYMIHGAPSNEMLGVSDPNAPLGDDDGDDDDNTESPFSVDYDFSQPPPSASRGSSRRNSQAEYQERPPMSFTGGSIPGTRRTSLPRALRSQLSRSSVTKEPIFEEESK